MQFIVPGSLQMRGIAARATRGDASVPAAPQHRSRPYAAKQRGQAAPLVPYSCWNRFFWLFIKLQEHFLERCLFGLQAYDLVMAERLDKWIHIATYIEVVGTIIVILAYHAHARDASKLFRCHGVTELHRHPLPCLLT